MSHVRMVFKGAMRHAEVMSFYKENRQDLFVQTSSSEGIPVSIMEALSFEIPVIATDVGGVSEIVEKSFGILLPENPTVADVKNAILSMMAKDAAEIEEMRRNARRSYEEKWDSDKNYNSFAAILLGIG